jgi:hypothetical protein
MSIVATPYTYTTNDVQTESWVYNFAVGSLTRTNTATVDTDIRTTINVFNNGLANINISSVTTITRSGTDPGAFTYTAAPVLRFNSGGVDFTYYSTSGSVSVGGNATGTVSFLSTFNILLPGNFLNKLWTSNHSVTVTETNTARVDSGFLVSPGFLIPSHTSTFFGSNF